MRFKLNSIHYGAQALAVIVTLTIGAPAVLYLAYRGLERLGYAAGVLLTLVKASVALGLVALALFVILLAIESAQDRYLDRWHRRHENEKLALTNGVYECQHCGSHAVRAEDRHCPVCGQSLE